MANAIATLTRQPPCQKVGAPAVVNRMDKEMIANFSQLQTMRCAVRLAPTLVSRSIVYCDVSILPYSPVRELFVTVAPLFDVAISAHPLRPAVEAHFAFDSKHVVRAA